MKLGKTPKWISIFLSLLAVCGAPAHAAAPEIIYTDIVSGPNSGGENNQGAYLSIFGKNFGSSGLGSTVRVYINNMEVSRYRSLGASKGRTDIQQITVQVGALGNPAPGVPLPIKVIVGTGASNTDHTFMVNPGRLLFVNNVSGNDATAVPGDITHPYRHVQTSNLSEGAWGAAQPGDFIVMRGTGTPWTDSGFENYFMRYRDKSGQAPTGASGTGPIVIMGYPAEDVFIRGTLAGGMTGGCISAINGMNYPTAGKWAVIANLRIDCEGYDGPISQEIYGDNWRVINNDLAASTAPTSGPNVPRMGGITGNGQNAVWLGNHIHDIQGSPQECHGIYIDGDGSYEIAYNSIENIRSGNGLQTYSNGTNGSDTIDNVNFHHNLIHDVSKHGINVADGAGANFALFDNIIYNTAVAGIRFNTTDLHGAKIYHNTFYNLGTSGYPAIMNDATLPADALDMENNIFCPHAGNEYTNLESGAGLVTHNLWHGGSGDYSLDAHPVTADPWFVNPGSDFHLQSASPAMDAGASAPLSLVTTDYDITTPRSAGAGPDLGAYEYTAGSPAQPPERPRNLRIR